MPGQTRTRRWSSSRLGFETTSPAVAATLGRAVEDGINNFLVFSVHKTIPGRDARHYSTRPGLT